jgi:hypothetical protein
MAAIACLGLVMIATIMPETRLAIARSVGPASPGEG